MTYEIKSRLIFDKKEYTSGARRVQNATTLISRSRFVTDQQCMIKN